MNNDACTSPVVSFNEQKEVGLERRNRQKGRVTKRIGKCMHLNGSFNAMRLALALNLIYITGERRKPNHHPSFKFSS